MEADMRRLFSIIVGLGLLGLGVLALTGTWVIYPLEIRLANVVIESPGQLWPLVVIGLGAALALVPIVVWRRWAGMFLIPALPILTTGGILMAGVLTRWPHLWSWAWPLEVLSLAATFVCAALYARIIWLLIPAIFLGLNGLVLQFCALTGVWGAWAVLWPVEFLAVGFTLLIVSFHARSGSILVLGLMFCGLSAAAMGGMLTLVSGQARLAGLFGAGSLIFLGAVLLVWSLFGQRRAPQPAASQAL
jgi:hypothetical protein